MESSILGNLVWVLPRPRVEPFYKGGFPLHFEKRLYRLLGRPSKVLHPFGGMAEIGVRVDISKDVRPDVVADAHYLPFIDGVFGAVVCDPPYSDEESQSLYNAQIPLHFQQWVNEAERVVRKDGFIVLYHDRWLPKPKHCSYWMRIIVLVSQHHRGRVVGVFQKD